MLDHVVIAGKLAKTVKTMMAFTLQDKSPVRFYLKKIHFLRVRGLRVLSSDYYTCDLGREL
jgi:hypothetical protein